MRILIWRHGAFGDCIVSTPLVRFFKQRGDEVVYVCNERGEQILRHNPHIETLEVEPKDVVPMPELPAHMERLRKKYNCDKILDLSESIEVALSQHPRSPNYKLPKQERFNKFNRNFYEYTFEHVKESWEGVDLKPEVFLTDEELTSAKSYLKSDHFNVTIGMAGSGGNKAWPHTEELCAKMKELIPNLHVITVGDERCQMIEPQGDYITNLSGKIPMRESMGLTKLSDLVIAPDTGLLHAAGCFDTPKIGMIGHNTRESITKYFTNDYSVEADPLKAQCAPCFYLVYDMPLQCPQDLENGGAYCMSKGIPTDKVLEQVRKVYGSKNR